MACSMNRLDRLAGILVKLQSNKTLTAQELSRAFGVCVRTVYRDIRSLETAGIPIGAEAGKGYFLAEGYCLPPVSLTPEEASALLIASKLAVHMTDASTAQNIRSAVSKIRAVLKDDVKDYLLTIDEKVSVCDGSPQPPIQADIMKIVETALHSGRGLALQYCSGATDQPTTRKVEPVSLGYFEGHWHMIAYCCLRNGYRNFRLDRIRSITLDNAPIERIHPPIGEILRGMLKTKPLTEVALRLDNDAGCEKIQNLCAVGVLNVQELSGRTEIRLVTDSIAVLSSWLNRYATNVEVLMPDELKALIHRQPVNT